MTDGLRVLVTGGAGFIGANLIRHLLRSRTASTIVVMDDLSSGDPANLKGMEVEFHQVSILDGERVRHLTRGCDAVVHLAAVPSVPRSIVDPLASHHANTTGTLHVLEAARSARARVLLASSSSVYGSNPARPKSEDLRCMPMSPYAVSKLATEAYGLAYSGCYELPVLALRLFNVFGPLQASGHAYAAVVPSFVSAAMRNEPLLIHGDGHQTRDFTYVGSVVDTMATALRQRISHFDAVNLAFGNRTSLLELVGVLESVLGRPLERRHGPARPGDVYESQADVRRLRSLFPQAQPVPLYEAVQHTVQWFRETQMDRVAPIQ